MNNKPHGPSPETLRRLFNHLPQLANGIKDGKLTSKGAPPLLMRPTAFCPICCTAHRPRFKTPESIVDVIPCKGCKGKLDSGLTALVCNRGDGQETTWISSKDPSIQGKALRLSHEQYDILKQHIGKMPTVKEGGEGEPKNN